MRIVLQCNNCAVLWRSQGDSNLLATPRGKGGIPMKHSPSHLNLTFRFAIAAGLLAGTLLMFGTLKYAASHMQVTM
jgi:hypothetical protein